MKDIAFHITDIVQNSIRANAERVFIEIALSGEVLTITIGDNGCGMDKETLQKVIDPFYTTQTTRKIGLGIPFLIQNAEQTGGNVTLKSELGVGTEICAKFITSSIDFPPMGDLPDTLSQLIAGNPSIHTIVYIKNGESDFEISSNDIKEILEEIPIGHPNVFELMKEIFRKNVQL